MADEAVSETNKKDDSFPWGFFGLMVFFVIALAVSDHYILKAETDRADLWYDWATFKGDCANVQPDKWDANNCTLRQEDLEKRWAAIYKELENAP